MDDGCFRRVRCVHTFTFTRTTPPNRRLDVNEDGRDVGDVDRGASFVEWAGVSRDRLSGDGGGEGTGIRGVRLARLAPSNRFIVLDGMRGDRRERETTILDVSPSARGIIFGFQSSMAERIIYSWKFEREGCCRGMIRIGRM